MLGNLLRELGIISEKNKNVRKYECVDNVGRKVVLVLFQKPLVLRENYVVCVVYQSSISQRKQTNSRASIVLPDFRIGVVAWESCDALFTAVCTR